MEHGPQTVFKMSGEILFINLTIQALIISSLKCY